MSITFLDVFTLLVFSSVAHTSSQPHSQTRDTSTYTLTIFRDFKISKIRRRHVLAPVLSRPHCRLCLRLCIGVKLRAASGPPGFPTIPAVPPLYKVCGSRIVGTAGAGAPRNTRGDTGETGDVVTFLL